jgi:hypothetical protein
MEFGMDDVSLFRRDKDTKDVAYCLSALLCMCFLDIVVMVIIRRCFKSEIHKCDVSKVFAHSDGHKDIGIEYMVQSLMLFYLIARRAAARQL